jgi:hypothetical protein
MTCCHMVKDLLYYHERYSTWIVEAEIDIEIVFKVSLSSVTYDCASVFTYTLANS